MFATELTTLVEWGDLKIQVNFWVVAFLIIALLVWVARNES